MRGGGLRVATVPVTSITQQGISRMVRDLRGIDPQPTRIDLSSMGGGRSNRLKVEWGLVLSNLLLGAYRSRPIELALPKSVSLARPLARAGLPFAISRRRMAWTGLGDDSTWVNRWASDWEPSEPQQPQFDLGDVVGGPEPARFERFLVGFLNPDVQPQDRVAVDGASVVRPWLRQMYSWMPSSELRNDPDELAAVVGDLTEELVENIRLHADLDERDGACFVNLFITRGGGVESGNRLYIAALDNGVGFPTGTALRPELDRLSPSERLAKAVNGELDTYARGRGRGWRDIKEIGAEWGGRVFVATGPATADSGGTLVVDGEFADRLEVDELPELPVQGSVVLIEIPMTVGLERPRRSERVRRRMQEPQLTLT